MHRGRAEADRQRKLSQRARPAKVDPRDISEDERRELDGIEVTAIGGAGKLVSGATVDVIKEVRRHLRARGAPEIIEIHEPQVPGAWPGGRLRRPAAYRETLRDDGAYGSTELIDDMAPHSIAAA
jgi:hypothetical protein